MQVVPIPIQNRITSKIGYVIGNHYSKAATSKSVVSMMWHSELCCGFGPEDLGILFFAQKFNDVAVEGLQLTGPASENRTAGVSAHVTSCITTFVTGTVITPLLQVAPLTFTNHIFFKRNVFCPAKVLGLHSLMRK